MVSSAPITHNENTARQEKRLHYDACAGTRAETEGGELGLAVPSNLDDVDLGQ